MNPSHPHSQTDAETPNTPETPAPTAAFTPAQAGVLLHKLAAAPEKPLTAGELRKAVTKTATQQTGLEKTAVDALLAELVAANHLQRQQGKNGKYILTTQGRAFAEALPPLMPPKPAKQPKPPRLREITPVEPTPQQRDLLLRKIFDKGETPLTAAQLAGAVNKKLMEAAGLDKAGVEPRLVALVAEGHLQREKAGRSEKYTLTTQGRAYAQARPAITPVEPTQRQREFLLYQLFATPGLALTAADVKKAVIKKVTDEIALEKAGVEPRLAALEAEGLLERQKDGRSIRYLLTEQGRAKADQLLPPGVKQAGNDDIRRYRTAYLLLQVLTAKDESLAPAEAKKLPQGIDVALELNVDTAEYERRRLVRQGLLRTEGEGRGVEYRLTPEGRQRLGTMDQCGLVQFKLTGDQLNRLLELARETARESAREFEAAAPPPDRDVSSEELAGAVLTACKHLTETKYHDSGLVPIHEVRTQIREQLGATAASHEVFDDVVKDLWRANKLRLLALSDFRVASAEQRQDSIPGVRETLFYMELAHETAAL